MKLAWKLALSHLRRRRTQNLISVLGVAIGVMVLTVALSLTNGFVRTLLDSTIKVLPHVDVRAWKPNGATRDAQLEAGLKSNKEVLGFGPYTLAKGFVIRRANGGMGARTEFAQVYGVDPKLEPDALTLDASSKLLFANLPKDGIILGDDLALNLGVLQGDSVVFFTSTETSNLSNIQSGAVRRVLRVVGTFNTRNYVFDSGLAFADLGALQEMLKAPGKIVGYHVRLRDPEHAREVGALLTQNTGFYPQPWQDINASLVGQMAFQKQVIGIVLQLIMIVAAFGIVNVLVLGVFEKTPEIAILRAMGASGRLIQQTFLFEGLLLGAVGIVLGNVLGFVVSTYFRLRPLELPGDLYFIDRLPVDMRFADFLWVSVASLVITLVAAVIPARRAASIEPTKIIR